MRHISSNMMHKHLVLLVFIALCTNLIGGLPAETNHVKNAEADDLQTDASVWGSFGVWGRPVYYGGWGGPCYRWGDRGYGWGERFSGHGYRGLGGWRRGYYW